MELLKQIDELKKEIAEIEKEPLETEEEKPEVTEETPPVETPAEPTKEEPKEEPKKETDPVKEELDNTGYARLRREKAAAEKKARELEDRLAALEAARQEQDHIEQPEQPRIEMPQELASVIERERTMKAVQEFSELEENFKRNAPEDFDDVANQYKTAIYQAQRLKNPRASHASLLEATQREILIRAGDYLSKGFDPIEEMYHDAKALGFQKAPAKAAETEIEETKEIKPDLNKVAENRSRNAGTVGAKGNGGSSLVTRAAASTMSPLEWSKLPREEKQRLLAGA